MSDALTEGLARFVCDASSAPIGEAGQNKVKKVVADTFAAILAGAGSDVASPVFGFAAASGIGSVPVLGTALSLSPTGAALVHGTCGAALDFDDVLSMMPGHPAAIILPALLSGLDGQRVDGATLLDAYVIGLEAGSKLSQGVGLGHYMRGFHASGTLALFCGVGALARLRRLDHAQTRTAFGIAASTASGLQANFGTMTKPFHSGWAAQSSVTAVDLASRGFTASQSIFEADRGFIDAYGTDKSDPSVVLPMLGDPWTILDPGVALKKFPTCYATHRAIDGLTRIEARVGRLLAQLDRVVCRVAPKALRPLPFPRPETGLESKFSMPHALAAALYFDTLRIASFSDAAVRIPEIRELYERIEVIEDMACVEGDPEWDNKSYGTRGFVRIEAHLADGRVETERVNVPPGHPKRELGWDDLESKFSDCGQSCGLPDDRLSRTFERLRALENEADIATLVEELTSGARPATPLRSRVSDA